MLSLYNSCPDAFYQFVESLDIQDVLSFSCICKQVRLLIYKSPQRDVWKRRWQESCSKVVSYNNPNEALQYFYYLKVLDNIRDLQNLLVSFHHTKQEKKQINVLDSVLGKGLEIPILKMLEKHKTDKMDSILSRALPSGNLPLIEHLLSQVKVMPGHVMGGIVKTNNIQLVKKAAYITRVDSYSFIFYPSRENLDKTEILNILLDSGYANLRKFIIYAIEYGKFPLADSLFARATDDAQHILREALTESIQSSNLAGIDYVLSKGYSIDARNGEALNFACGSSSIDSAAHLLKRGANIHLFNRTDIESICPEILGMLMDKGMTIPS